RSWPKTSSKESGLMRSASGAERFVLDLLGAVGVAVGLMLRAPTLPSVSVSGELWPGPSSNARFLPAILFCCCWWPLAMGGLTFPGMAIRFAEGVWKKDAAADRFWVEMFE